MKIEKLSPGQIARFPEFIKRWTDIGLSTEPANRPEAEKGVIQAYKVAGLPAPKIVWCGSPMSQGLTRAIIFGLKDAEIKIGKSVRDSVWDSVGDSVWDSVWDSVGDSVRDSVWDSVWDSVGDSVGDSVRDSVGDSVGDSVRDSVWDSVGDSVWDSVRDSVGDSVRDSGYGQHDASWIGFYEYFKIACGLEKETQKLCGIWQLSQHAGWWMPHKNLCWISERHNILHRNSAGRLHKDGAMALAYPDGWGIYALNGVRMKPEHVLTPAEQIDPAKVLGEENVEQRRELIRKIGVERFLAKAPHRVLETKGDYQLLSVELSPEIRDARYLKMLNPSIGVWHVEGVHPTCKTVQHALNWRASRSIEKEWSPEVLT